MEEDDILLFLEGWRCRQRAAKVASNREDGSVVVAEVMLRSCCRCRSSDGALLLR